MKVTASTATGKAVPSNIDPSVTRYAGIEPGIWIDDDDF